MIEKTKDNDNGSCSPKHLENIRLRKAALRNSRYTFCMCQPFEVAQNQTPKS